MGKRVRNEINGGAENRGTVFQAGEIGTFADGGSGAVHTGDGDTYENTGTGTAYTGTNVREDGVDGVHILGGNRGGLTFNA
ncbi:hypothetical protein [Streptomyces chrestomyceticus]|uniref:hypothetical protein n=1 Tax=Streptomyces chrestomyceticus TaxID=68185 RepID=UPI0033C98CB2